MLASNADAILNYKPHRMMYYLNMKVSITTLITDFVAEYSNNPDKKTEWKKPLVGFASAADPLFSRLPELASPTHVQPQDFLPGAQTVIAYFMPFNEEVAKTNIRGRLSSDLWCTAYIETNEMILALNNRLKAWFESKGYEGIVIPATHNWDVKKLISDWSHRSIAYIAGLGRFGLNNMLITDEGCCGRFGSFITSAVIEADKRSEQESCLYKHDGSCGACVKRCVNDALHINNFDRFKCYDMCLENEKAHRNLGYADVCGKCLAGIPCSFRDPVKHRGLLKS